MAFKRFSRMAAATAFACLSMGANAGLVTSLTGANGFESKTVAASRVTENLNAFEEGFGERPLQIFVGSPYAPAKLHAGSSGAISEAFADNNGRYFDGSPFWDAGGQDFYIEFTSAISAFGFDGSDIGDFGKDDGKGEIQPVANALTVCLANSANIGLATKTLCESVPSPGTDNGRLFAGIYDNRVGAAYNFVHFINNTGGLDGQAFDNFIAAIANVSDTNPNPNPAPEPVGLALVGLGLLGLAGTRRRR